MEQQTHHGDEDRLKTHWIKGEMRKITKLKEIQSNWRKNRLQNCLKMTNSTNSMRIHSWTFLSSIFSTDGDNCAKTHTQTNTLPHSTFAVCGRELSEESVQTIIWQTNNDRVGDFCFLARKTTSTWHLCKMSSKLWTRHQFKWIQMNSRTTNKH